jgi:quercetin dioxygenase-like cupin family protein
MPNNERSPDKWYFRSPSEGLARTLSPGVVTHVVAGERVMLSFVEVEPHTTSPIHSHPEEQWGYLLSGSCVRIQGPAEIPMHAGDFWCTPSNVVHGIRTGPEHARILDIFSPPRGPYVRPGTGFGVGEEEQASESSVPRDTTGDERKQST